MSATMVARAMSTSTGSVTVPMTTRFTPPTECKTHWTYEDSYYNSISNGILVQNQVTTRGIGVDTECFPSGWTGNGRASDQQTQVFSPGACPVNYATAAERSDQGTTTGVCCYSKFQYIESGNFVGCISMFPSGTTTAVTGWAQLVGQSSDNMTQVAGPMTMWAQAMTVAYRQNDLSLFSATTSSSDLPTSTSDTAVAAHTSSSATATSAAASPTLTAGSSEHSSSQPTSSGLNSSEKLGIGFAVAIGVLALVSMSLFILRQRRKYKAMARQLGMEQKHIPLGDGSSGTAVEAPDHEIYQLPAEPKPCELHGSNWPERYLPSRTVPVRSQDRRTIHQLPAEPGPSELYGSLWQK